MDKLISQQAAIDTLKELTANGTNKGMVFGEDAVHRIEMLPSVQPERKTGKWIDAVIADTLQVIVCDQCNTFFPLAFGDSHNFCPNCGAKMEGGE